MSMTSYFVTGTNRGLGLEFVRQLLAKPDTRVVATAREPTRADELLSLQKTVSKERLLILKYDVTDFASAKEVAKQAEEFLPDGLDVFISNAGAILQRGKSLEDQEWGLFMDTFAVNSVSPFVTLQALLPLLRKGKSKKVLFISSGAGSVGGQDARPKRPDLPEIWFPCYNMSKAALNMGVKRFGQELAPEGFTLIPIQPGWVRTDGGGPMAPLEPEESISGMLEVLDGAKLEDTTKFVDYKGNPCPW